LLPQYATYLPVGRQVITLSGMINYNTKQILSRIYPSFAEKKGDSNILWSFAPNLAEGLFSQNLSKLA